MHAFICGEEIGKLAVTSCKKYYSFQSAANLSIYQNISKMASSKLLTQKLYFQNFSLKNAFQKHFLKNCSLKKYISKNFF